MLVKEATDDHDLGRLGTSTSAGSVVIAQVRSTILECLNIKVLNSSCAFYLQLGQISITFHTNTTWHNWYLIERTPSKILLLYGATYFCYRSVLPMKLVISLSREMCDSMPIKNVNHITFPADVIITIFNILRPSKNGRHCADDILITLPRTTTVIFWFNFHWNLFQGSN